MQNIILWYYGMDIKGERKVCWCDMDDIVILQTCDMDDIFILQTCDMDDIVIPQTKMMI